eukprot:Trichotokara_eunicae@DN5505_c0_g1_i5.p2
MLLGLISKSKGEAPTPVDESHKCAGHEEDIKVEILNDKEIMIMGSIYSRLWTLEEVKQLVVDVGFEIIEAKEGKNSPYSVENNPDWNDNVTMLRVLARKKKADEVITK